MKPATHGGPIQLSLMDNCKSKKRCQVDFPLFLFLVLGSIPHGISEGEEEVEDTLIKICSAQVWRERNYTWRTRLYEIISSFEDML